MKNQNLGLLDTETLLKKQRSLKVLTGMLAGMLMVLFALTIFISIKKTFSPLSVVPIALLPIVILNLLNLKTIKKELDSRGE
jgi:Na+-transporting methylmalonyl-CoA/oxaloacetate decarboxylase beta subunit